MTSPRKTSGRNSHHHYGYLVRYPGPLGLEHMRDGNRDAIATDAIAAVVVNGGRCYPLNAGLVKIECSRGRSQSQLLTTYLASTLTMLSLYMIKPLTEAVL